MTWRSMHIGRSWDDNRLERRCPCPLEPCGLVDSSKIDPSCSQHPMGRFKTMRQGHPEKHCPGPRPNHPTTKLTKEELMAEILRTQPPETPIILELNDE